MWARAAIAGLISMGSKSVGFAAKGLDDLHIMEFTRTAVIAHVPFLGAANLAEDDGIVSTRAGWQNVIDADRDTWVKSIYMNSRNAAPRGQRGNRIIVGEEFVLCLNKRVDLDDQIKFTFQLFLGESTRPPIIPAKCMN